MCTSILLNHRRERERERCKEPYPHEAEKGVQNGSGSEEDFEAVVEVMSEEAEPPHHAIPVVTVDKLRTLLLLHGNSWYENRHTHSIK